MVSIAECNDKVKENGNNLVCLIKINRSLGMKFRTMQAIFLTGPWFFKVKVASARLNFQEYIHHNSRALDLCLNKVCVFIFFLQTVSKYMNGLLNTKGGVLVFGVRPRTGIPLQPSFLKAPNFYKMQGCALAEPTGP